MATKKTEKTKTTAKKAPAKKAPAKKAAATSAEKAEKKAKAPAVKPAPRFPLARVKAGAGSKEALAKALAPTLAIGNEDTDVLEKRLKTASNAQLLRLQKVADAVKQKYGSRAGLIEAIGKTEKKSKDKDYLAKLETFSLPHLLDLAVSGERRARA